MPNFVPSEILRNSVTTAALLFAVPASVSSTSATVSPLPIRAGAPSWMNRGALYEAAGVATSQWPVAKKAEITPPLTAFGRRLFALRQAAIAAGMQTASAEHIIEEFRAARDA
jgi:hypothetical protein